MIALAIAGWALAAPSSIGGPLTYVSTKGNSMEPKFHQGDLVVVKKRSGYKVGDIVAYKSESLNAVVVHRVIGRDGERYVFQGDNNSFVDSEHPRPDQMLGKYVFHAGGFGKKLLKVKSPIGLLTIAVLLVLIFKGRELFGLPPKQKRAPTTNTTTARHRAGGPSVSGSSADGPEPSDADSPATTTLFERAGQSAPGLRNATIACLALGLIIGAAGYSRAREQHVTRQQTYEHRGSFSYDTNIPHLPEVYQDGKLRTGDPLFLKLVPRFNALFTYSLEGAKVTDVKGTIRFDAEIRGQDGWTRRFHLSKPRKLEQGSTLISARVDLDRIKAEVDAAAELSGVAHSPADFVLSPKVKISAKIDGQSISETFEPELHLELTELEARLQPSSGAAGEKSGDTAPVKGSTVDVKRTEASTLSIAGIAVSVTFLRKVAIGLLLLGFLLGLSLSTKIGEAVVITQSQRIEAAFGALLVRGQATRGLRQRLILVESIEDLIRIAERNETIVLHQHIGDRFYYRVDIDQTTYGYSFVESAPVPEVAPGIDDARIPSTAQHPKPRQRAEDVPSPERQPSHVAAAGVSAVPAASAVAARSRRPAAGDGSIRPRPPRTSAAIDDVERRAAAAGPRRGRQQPPPGEPRRGPTPAAERRQLPPVARHPAQSGRNPAPNPGRNPAPDPGRNPAPNPSRPAPMTQRSAAPARPSSVPGRPAGPAARDQQSRLGVNPQNRPVRPNPPNRPAPPKRPAPPNRPNQPDGAVR